MSPDRVRAYGSIVGKISVGHLWQHVFDSRNGLDIQSNVLNLPGRIGTMGGTMTYTYLGDGTKVAAVVNLSAPASTPTDNAILEQNCYTPFGTRLQSTDLKTQAANRWRYNYFSMSPYSYCGNDPVNMVDPEGNNWYKNNKTQQYEWFAGTGEIEGYKNCGETIEDMENRNYYSLFGTVVSMDDNYGNLANVYRVIDKALKRYFSPEEVSQNSWDTEYSQTNMKVDFIVTNDFDFVYKGKEFSSIEGTTKTGRMIEIGFSEQQYKALRETLSKQLGD